MFTGRTDAEAEALILWPPDVKSQLIGEDPDARKNWRQKEKGAAEDEMVNNITDQMNMNLSKLWETMKDREAWHGAVRGITVRWTRLSEWATDVQISTYSQR